MNCLEYRRRVGAAPGERDAAMDAHAAQCAACAAHGRRAERLDALLERALRFEPPAGLSARVLLAQEFASGRSRRRIGRRSLAIAATVVIATLAGAIGWWHGERSHPLGREVMALVNTATFALEADGPVSPDDVDRALRRVGVGLERPVGDVTFASPCVVRGQLAGHLVLRGEIAKITVLLMPRERIDRRAEFSAYHFNGVLLPSSGGTVAIVGTPGEPLAPIAERIERAVRWSPSGPASAPDA